MRQLLLTVLVGFLLLQAPLGFATEPARIGKQKISQQLDHLVSSHVGAHSNLTSLAH
jgi:hypothetical protein